MSSCLCMTMSRDILAFFMLFFFFEFVIYCRRLIISCQTFMILVKILRLN